MRTKHSGQKSTQQRGSRHPLEVRPIGARPLKSAMDTLRPYCSGSIVLDLFAGHGRLGLGALSEGAISATFVESHRPTLTALERSAKTLRDKCLLRCLDAFKFLEREAASGRKYTLAFADPPFSLWEGSFHQRLFSAVSGVLTHNAIFVVKYPARMVVFTPTSDWLIWKDSVFGESRLTYFRYGNLEHKE